MSSSIQRMTQEQLIEAMEYMDAGIFMQKFVHAMSEVALNTAVHGDNKRVGKVVCEFTFQRQGQTQGMNVTHKLTMKRLDSKGETQTTTVEMTPFYVKKGGVLAFVQDEEQGEMFGASASQE